MTVLAVDTSSRRRVVCVLADGGGECVREIVEEDVDIDRALPPALRSLLSPDVTGVAVVTGPGSYTGVRAGMAAALGIAHARGLPLCGVASLVPVWRAADATGAPQGWAVTDAGRGAIYAMRFGGGGTSAPGDWARVELAAFEPDGLPVYSADTVPIDGLRRVDAAVGLALAARHALCRPLRPDTMLAEH